MADPPALGNNTCCFSLLASSAAHFPIELAKWIICPESDEPTEWLPYSLLFNMKDTDAVEHEKLPSVGAALPER